MRARIKKMSICAAFLAMRAGYAIRRINLIWPNLCIIFRMNIGKYGVKFTTVLVLKDSLISTNDIGRKRMIHNNVTGSVRQ